MREAQFPVEYLGNYIDGQFAKPQSSQGKWEVFSPANTHDRVGEMSYGFSDIDRAVEVAQRAQKHWKRTSLQDRMGLLKAYQAQLKQRESQLAEVLSREVGKPLWESKTEVDTMINKVDVTIQESMKLVEEVKIAKASPNADGVWRNKPLGVTVVVGPFNFPGHLPNGHIVPALLTGNAVLFKPSEKTPFTGQVMAECFHAAGFPKGVFNLIQGEREVSRRLCTHEGVDAVLFTGSYEVGMQIKQDTLQQYWKLLALEMGGKNSAIVWEDASIEAALRDTLIGAFITTGQRCSCTSRVMLHESIAQSFIERFHARAKAFKIGHPFDEPFMGPLIDRVSVDRYMKFQDIAPREGFDVLMRGKVLELDSPGNYITPSIMVMRDPTSEKIAKSVYQQTELFAPNVSFLVVKDLDEAIAYANATQYGLVASVFTQDRKVYEKCLDDLDTGLVNWNTTTVGASSKLPFGGTKKSGNHWPTAVTATRYCTYPVASLEVESPSAEAPKQPGLNWKS